MSKWMKTCSYKLSVEEQGAYVDMFYKKQVELAACRFNF